MSLKRRRHPLKSKEAKQVLNQVSERLGIDLGAILGTKVVVEVVMADFGQLFLIGGEPFLFRVGENVFPTLFFKDLAARLPKIVVDMGAVPYVCKGADIMAPGIVRIEGEFSKGGIVVVTDEKHGKPLALGASLYDSDVARVAKQGAVVKNYHFVSDRIWNFAKPLAE
jgi:PUA domain protein